MKNLGYEVEIDGAWYWRDEQGHFTPLRESVPQPKSREEVDAVLEAKLTGQAGQEH